MSRFSLHIGLRDCGAMTCDYDNDHFNQRLKFQHSRECGHGHGQWSWLKSPEVPCPEVKNNEVYF